MELRPHGLTAGNMCWYSEFGRDTYLAAVIPISALPPTHYLPTLALKLSRGEPAITEFDWNFSANHTSSPSFAQLVGSGLHGLLHPLHPGHG